MLIGSFLIARTHQKNSRKEGRYVVNLQITINRKNKEKECRKIIVVNGRIKKWTSPQLNMSYQLKVELATILLNWNSLGTFGLFVRDSSKQSLISYPPTGNER